jgi:NAD(P)-dependent dehydrogenase (short-subunit alcohol dehydrogenase family)
MAQRAARRAALVSGASWGIDAATAIGLAEDGLDVAVTDLSIQPLAHTVAAIEARGGLALPLALDVRDQASVEQCIADVVAAFGGLDLLVNNAGVPSPGKPAIDISRAEWDANIAVNLSGTFFMSTAFGRWAIGAGRPGSVISLASTHGTVGFAGTAPYGIAKAGISHMTRILAIEWAPHKIRVNAVAPGTTLTETRRPMLQDPERHARMPSRIPLGRFGEPDEMASAIRYLASPQASYITGQILLLDGGLTAY